MSIADTAVLQAAHSIAAALLAVAGAAPEAPAAPDSLEVSVASGAPLRGAPARIDIRHKGAGAVQSVEVTFAATDGTRTWAAHILAPPRFLQTCRLKAQVSDRPLAPGQASVQMGSPDAGSRMARDGWLSLSLQHDRLVGSYLSAAGRGRNAEIRFSGPYVISRSRPASDFLPNGAASGSDTGVRIVDEHVTSALCSPSAALGQGRQTK